MIIAISIVFTALAVGLLLIVYNQLLAMNEINKRLMLLANEAIAQERITMQEYQDALRELDARAAEQDDKAPVPDDMPFPEYYNNAEMDGI